MRKRQHGDARMRQTRPARVAKETCACGKRDLRYRERGLHRCVHIHISVYVYIYTYTNTHICICIQRPAMWQKRPAHMAEEACAYTCGVRGRDNWCGARGRGEGDEEIVEEETHGYIGQNEDATVGKD